MPCFISFPSMSMIRKSENITIYSFFSLSVPLRCLVVNHFIYLFHIPLHYVHKRHTEDLVRDVVCYVVSFHYCQQICSLRPSLFYDNNARSTRSACGFAHVRLSVLAELRDLDLCLCDLGIISDEPMFYLSSCVRITFFHCVSTWFSCCLLLDLTILSISQIGFTHHIYLTACRTLLRRYSCQLSASVVADSYGLFLHTPRGNIFRTALVHTMLVNSQNSIQLTTA